MCCEWQQQSGINENSARPITQSHSAQGDQWSHFPSLNKAPKGLTGSLTNTWAAVRYHFLGHDYNCRLSGLSHTLMFTCGRRCDQLEPTCWSSMCRPWQPMLPGSIIILDMATGPLTAWRKVKGHSNFNSPPWVIMNTDWLQIILIVWRTTSTQELSTVTRTLGTGCVCSPVDSSPK